ncbi:unnamed protein product, partial [Fusarium graminearum]
MCLLVCATYTCTACGHHIKTDTRVQVCPGAIANDYRNCTFEFVSTDLHYKEECQRSPLTDTELIDCSHEHYHKCLNVLLIRSFQGYKLK